MSITAPNPNLLCGAFPCCQKSPGEQQSLEPEARDGLCGLLMLVYRKELPPSHTLWPLPGLGAPTEFRRTGAYCLCGPNCPPACSLSVSFLHIYAHPPLSCKHSQTREAGLLHPPAHGQAGGLTPGEGDGHPRAMGSAVGVDRGGTASMATPLATCVQQGGREAGLWRDAVFWAWSEPLLFPAPPAFSLHFAQLLSARLAVTELPLHRAHTHGPPEPPCPTLEVKEPDTP